ncbi:MAG: sulfatase [Planctomycetota bacterium]
MPPRTSPLARLLALLAGTQLFAFLHALLLPGFPGAGQLDLKLLVLFLSDGAAAAGFLLLSFPFPRLRRDARGSFWQGAALALAPLLVSWGLSGRTLPGGRASELLPPILGLFVAWLLLGLLPRLPLPAPGRRVGALLASGTLLVWGGLFLGLGVDRDSLPHPALPAAGRAPTPPPQGPDVVLISVDTLRADALTDPATPMPALDALKSRGLSAAYALAPAPSTVPSHVSMLSGRSPLRHGAWGNSGRVPPDLPMLADAFGKRGWRTAAVVSNGMLRARNGFARGFEAFADISTTRSARLLARRNVWLDWLLPKGWSNRLFDALTNRRRAARSLVEGEKTVAVALDYLQNLEAGPVPFFLFCHFIDPHAPYAPPGVDLTAPGLLPTRYAKAQLGNRRLPDAVEEDLRSGIPEAREAAAVLHRLYQQEVAAVDGFLGRLLARIEASGRPTVILFTADHGEQFGEHDRMEHADSVFETLLRVPFLLAGPGVPASVTLDPPPHLEDIAPTLLGLAGIPAPAGRFDGVDLLHRPARRGSYWSWMPHRFALRKDGWKLAGSFERGPDGYSKVEARALFHLPEDPRETTDLAAREPARTAALLEEARKLLSRARVGSRSEMTPEFQALLQQMGYVGEE